MKNDSFSVKIFIKEEDNMFIAHCLELDIVTTAKTMKQAKEDIDSLISAQILFAVENDNLDNLFHPAPLGAWADFFKSTEKIERQYKLPLSKKELPKSIIIPCDNQYNNDIKPCYA
jgi:hypothetical protein